MRPINTIIMAYMHVAPDVCHDSILWHLRDAKRVVPKNGVDLPHVIASPLIDTIPEPWESFASNETGFPAHFEALYQCPLPLAHSPSSSIGVVEVHINVVDSHLRNIHV
jgi:hypothetical protein